MSKFEGEIVDELEFIQKYSGHWYLKTDEERARHAISTVRYTIVLHDDEYTKGFIQACRQIESKFNELMKEKSDV
jgi:hypothetical protein